MIYKIYCLKDEQGEIRYVGYTSLTEARRMAEHRHSHPERANYTFHVIDVFDNKKDALEAERMYIDMYKPSDNIAPGQGYPKSLEAGRIISHEKMSKPVYCVETNTVYPSVSQAARELGLTQARVKDCCKGVRHQAHGYHFVYYSE